MAIAAALVIAMMIAPQADKPAKPAAETAGAGPQVGPVPEPAVSVERIRDGLRRPALIIPPIDLLPVFRGSVEVDMPLDTPLQAMRRELAVDSGYRGRGGVDVIALVTGMVNSIKAAYRAHKEAEIRERVQAELNAFCVDHDCSVLENGPPPIAGVIIPRKRPTQ